MNGTSKLGCLSLSSQEKHYEFVMLRLCNKLVYLFVQARFNVIKLFVSEKARVFVPGKLF
jgi:hypothetical protein